MNDLLTLTEALEIINKEMFLTRCTLTDYCRAGKIPGAIKKCGTRWYVPLKSVLLLAKGQLNVSGTYSGIKRNRNRQLRR